VLEALVRDHGWEAGPDRGPSAEMIELRRGAASITLEPGGQLELSGAPLTNVHETCAEFTQHYQELDAVSRPLGLAWLAVGHHPFATREEIQWMPKGRYAIMRDYLPRRGSLGLDMMLRTCTVQANFDYTSERQCGERVRLASAMAPVITAIFANSPYVEGRHSGFQSRRSHVWTDVDPDRCGIPRFFFEPGFTFERYVEWALQVPMFFVKRDGSYHAHHVPFAEFLRDGWIAPDGRRHPALLGDWTTHLSTLFPEVRLKPHLEFRSADAVGSKFVCALPALLKGLLYDEDATAEAWEIFAEMDYDARMKRWHEATRVGLHAEPIRERAVALVRIARTALDRMDVRDARGRTEARFLDPLEPLVERGLSPADEAIAALGPSPGRDAGAQHAFADQFLFAGTTTRGSVASAPGFDLS
jgi:glutamate--cysteine ligase